MATNVIERSNDILGGTPVFAGTRVPIKTLIDYLEAGDNINDFLEDFPTVTHQQAEGFLEYIKEVIIKQIDESAA